MARAMRRSVLSVTGADGSELIAVVHEPEGPPVSVTVLLAGGVLPRMGVNRVLVRMADRLAAAGHRVVRVDPHGLGESAGTLPEEPFFDLLRRVESGAFVDDVRLTAEAVAPAEDGVPLVLFGTCGGGITALRVAEQMDRVTGVIAVGVPLKRSGARIPPGYARRTERRRALRQLAELRHRTGSGRVRRVIRPLVWSLVPRFSRRLPADADNWLNTPLLGSLRALYGRAPARLAAVRRERHRARRDRRAVPRAQPPRRAALVRARADSRRGPSARRPGRGRCGRRAHPGLRRATPRAGRALGGHRQCRAAPCR